MSSAPTHLFKDPTYVFWMSILVSFCSLVLYRFTVISPVWFDELFLKAILFGFPVWLYAIVTKKSPAFFGLEANKFWPGAINGLAIGGILSFTAIMAYSFRKSTILMPGLFETVGFWKEFGLAFATAWWESLFFYGLILPVFKEKFSDEIQALTFATLAFLLFHAPNLIVKVGVAEAIQPLLLLTLFAFGQGIIFLRTKSISTVVVSHAFWGMALLVYGR